MNIELLLTQDVASLGRSGDLVTVKPGYARNFLLPQGKAVRADKRAIRMRERLQEERKQLALQERKEAEKTATLLAELDEITVYVKVDSEGHLYGSVAAQDIVHALLQYEIHVDKREIVLAHPIKATGSHVVPFKLKEGVTAEIVVHVIPEKK